MNTRTVLSLCARCVLLMLCALFAADAPVPKAFPVPEPPEGFWEDSGSCYAELRNGRLTCRDSRRKVILDTPFSAIGGPDGRTELIPEDRELHYEGDAPFGTVTEVYLLEGELHLTKRYTSLSEDIESVLLPAEYGPFGHILILDEKLMPELEGLWTETEKGSARLELCKGQIRMWDGADGYEWLDESCHVIRYRGAEDAAPLLVPEDLTESEFPGFTSFEYRDGKLSTVMIVYDAETVTRFTFERSSGQRSP